jgi:hypothetical protein
MTDRLNVNPLVAMLLGDSTNQPDLVILNGYIGPSPDVNCISLYTSTDLHSKVEVRKDQIKGWYQIGPDSYSGSPLPSDMLWIRREDALQLRETSVRATGAQPPSPGPTGPGLLYPPKP